MVKWKIIICWVLGHYTGYWHTDEIGNIEGFGGFHATSKKGTIRTYCLRCGFLMKEGFRSIIEVKR